MSRRSASNERYQKYTGPKGQTRKSAAQAKPSRKEGSGSTSSSSKTKNKSKASSAATKPGGKYYEPNTPEYKYWRRLWWIALIAGLVLVAISFYLQYYLKAYPWSRTAGVVTIVLSYAAIIAAFFIDYRKLRAMRQGKHVPKLFEKPAEKPADKNADKPDAGDSADKS